MLAGVFGVGLFLCNRWDLLLTMKRIYFGTPAHTAEMRIDTIRMHDGSYGESKSRWWSGEGGRSKLEIFEIDGKANEGLIVSDGRKRWNVLSGVVLVGKMEREWWGMRFSQLFEFLINKEKVRDLGESIADGVETFNYEMTVHLPPPNVDFHTMQFSIGKEDGVPRVIAVYDVDGVAVAKTTFSGVKTGVKIDDSLFRYSPPPGAKPWNIDKK